MIEKGFLKHSDGVHLLSSNTSSIGREDCDIIINDKSTDQQHAVIEFCAIEDCFVLHDLNTAQGTYVNDCRIQNAAVRLAPGDIIKFGFSGKPYELHMENPSKFQKYLPVQQRPSWNSPIQIVVSSPRYVKSEESNTFPVINVSSTKVSPASPKTSCVHPHPPLLSRPRSAETLKQSTFAMSSLPNLDYSIKSLPTELEYNTSSMVALREKEKKIVHMGDEINRLAIFEQESKRKDSVIVCLRDELSQLREKLCNDDQLSHSQIFQKVQAVEKELFLRRDEVGHLRQQLDAVNASLTASPTLTSQLAESEKKIHSFRKDVDEAKKECAMSQGLIFSLQREIQTKDDIIKKATMELDHIKREMKRKDIQLSSISSKFTRISEDKTKDETIDKLKREVKELKIKHRMIESRSTDQLGLLQTYKDEISKLQAKNITTLDEHKNATKQFEEMKQKYFEMQRSERILRVDLEQIQTQLNRFRTRITNALYSTSGLQKDSQSIDDDNSTVDNIKEVIKLRLDLKNQLEELKEEMKSKEVIMDDMKSSFDACHDALEQTMGRICESGHKSRLLKNEADLLLSFSMGDKHISWIYKMFGNILRSGADWNVAIEEALTEAGYNVSLDDKNPAVHVSDLHRTLSDEKEAHQLTMNSLSELEQHHQNELESNINKLLKENEEKLAAEIERVRLEEQSRFEESLNELHMKEEEKRREVLQEEREKIKSVNLGMVQLQKLLADKQSEENELQLKLQHAYENIEKHKNTEKQLKDDLTEVEHLYKLTQSSTNENVQQIKNKYEDDIMQYKEEIRQHSITIVSMENQIQNLSKQFQDSQTEMKCLKSKLQDSEKRRVITPPPPPNVDTTHQQEIVFLKTELLHASHEIQLLKNTIVGLRRDLSGSQARISDMTGELSESQKQELEHNRSRCKNQEIELNTIRQKLLKMSGLVDSQKDHIVKLQEELRKQQQAGSVRQAETNEQKDNLKELESKLVSEQTKTEENNAIKVKKGRISEELLCVGAQCRGERHEDVITRQSEALAELRARIKALEQIRPPLPSQEQALQQVILLKKELAEIRAKQAIEEDKQFQTQLSLDNEVVDAQHQLRSATTQASIERVTREQLEIALECAERNYMDLLNSLCSMLGIKTLSAVGTLQHAPQDEREKLCAERKVDLDKITNSVKSALQQLDRKEQLLQGYEKDLGKLRDAEHFAAQRSTRVDNLAQQLMEKSEENDHLREALTQTHETLELEKRLNKSIKERKTFHLENLDVRRAPPRGHSEVYSNKESNKNKQKQKMKRKNYEIDVLKERVHGKERDLCDATARLVNLECSTSHGDEITNIYKNRENDRDGSVYSDR